MEILGGPFFGVAGAGESHGPGISTIVFGCPPGLEIERGEIQTFLNRRRPGSSKLGTPRREDDQVLFLAGLYDEDHDALLSGPGIQVAGKESSIPTYAGGFTTGEPIAALVLSEAKRSADYEQLAGPRGEVRPGHTDLVKHYKSAGFTDVRGGGRSSFRSTISDVVGGSIARIFLRRDFGTLIFSSICQVGSLKADVRLAERVDELTKLGGGDDSFDAIEQQLKSSEESSEVRSLDPEFAAEARKLITSVRKQGDSLGASIEVAAVNVPPLVGNPLYQSLKMRLMGALGGLHAVQSCEIGSGRDVVERTGSENNDPIRSSGYQSNHHGGLLGGITTGMPLICLVGFKPTSSIAKKQESVRKNLEEIDFELKKGRHDPCVGVRACVTLESRVAVELVNAVLAHQASRVDPGNFELF